MKEDLVANRIRRQNRRPKVGHIKRERRERRNALHYELARHTSDFKHDVQYIHKHIDKLWEHVVVTNERIGNLEAQVNLLSRLVTTLCIEKLGIKLRSFKRLVCRLEQEAIADSEIRDLQELFQIEHNDINSKEEPT
jgi:hypothetical protein